MKKEEIVLRKTNCTFNSVEEVVVHFKKFLKQQGDNWRFYMGVTFVADINGEEHEFTPYEVEQGKIILLHKEIVHHQDIEVTLD
jgi:hypothetical protein